MKLKQPDLFQRVQAMADAWRLSRGNPILLLRNKELARANLYFYYSIKESHPEIYEYVIRSMAEPDNGYEEVILLGRSYCSKCSERYAHDNLSLCTECDIRVCPSCSPMNTKCDCGGMLVGG